MCIYHPFVPLPKDDACPKLAWGVQLFNVGIDTWDESHVINGHTKPIYSLI